MVKAKRKQSPRNRGSKKYDRNKWNVVTEAPGQPVTVVAFTEPEAASTYLYRLIGVGKATYTKLLPPTDK